MTPRAASGVIAQGATSVARPSWFYGVLGQLHLIEQGCFTGLMV